MEQRRALPRPCQEAIRQAIWRNCAVGVIHAGLRPECRLPGDGPHVSLRVGGKRGGSGNISFGEFHFYPVSKSRPQREMGREDHSDCAVVPRTICTAMFDLHATAVQTQHKLQTVQPQRQATPSNAMPHGEVRDQASSGTQAVQGSRGVRGRGLLCGSRPSYPLPPCASTAAVPEVRPKRRFNAHPVLRQGRACARHT